jgi:hypothetical protein
VFLPHLIDSDRYLLSELPISPIGNLLGEVASGAVSLRVVSISRLAGGLRLNPEKVMMKLWKYASILLLAEVCRPIQRSKVFAA